MAEFFEILRWVSLIVLWICIALNIWTCVRGVRLNKRLDQRWEQVPMSIIENGKLWRINRKLFEWVRMKHPESYEEFVAECLSEEELALLQVFE